MTEPKHGFTTVTQRSRKWDVFISHASQDIDSARRVCAALENSGWSVFLAARERANVPPGATGHAGHVFRPAATSGTGHFLRMTPLAEHILGRVSRSIWVLQAAAALVLLIACANIANLLLARAESRQREFAVLTALGAGRAQILRKALTESVLLALAGCALGVVIARAGLQMLIRTSLKSGGRGSSGATRHHLRRGLVVAETALTVIVAVGAGLLLRTVHNLTAVDAGFQRERLLTFSITLPLESTNIRTAIIGVP